MVNRFEAFWNTFKTLVDNEPKSPLHVGEVMAIWTYQTILLEAVRYEEVALNTTTDDEVKELIIDAKKLCENQSQRLANFMVKEGIPLPPSPQPKPLSEPNDVPLGVKLTDDEIMNGISLKIAAAAMECAAAISQSIRSDVGLFWTDFFIEMITFGATTKTLMRKRGWLKVPPYYSPPGMPGNG